MAVKKPSLVELASGASRFAIPAHEIKYDSRSPVSTAGHSTLEMLGQLGDALASLARACHCLRRISLSLAMRSCKKPEWSDFCLEMSGWYP